MMKHVSLTLEILSNPYLSAIRLIRSLWSSPTTLIAHPLVKNLSGTAAGLPDVLDAKGVDLK